MPTTTSRASHPWQTRQLDDLLETVLALRTLERARSFFRDLCTPAELEAMAQRWEVAQLVERGIPYLEISRRTGASTATVTRVAHWLHDGEGGYRAMLDRSRRRTAARG